MVAAVKCRAGITRGVRRRGGEPPAANSPFRPGEEWSAFDKAVSTVHARSAWNAGEARLILEEEAKREGGLLPALHRLMERFGHIPEEADAAIAQVFNLSRAEVQGVISFYHDFRREPAGRHILRLCRAEACQSRGGRELATRFLERSGLGWGETTPDGALTLEPVYCLGLCAVAPAALFDDEPHGRLDAERLEALLGRARGLSGGMAEGGR